VSLVAVVFPPPSDPGKVTGLEKLVNAIFAEENAVTRRMQ
jgi:hypothetical protein